MANTTSILSYANTFGDWVVQSNSLSKENNDLAANNYIKPTGTLYLNGLPLGLQVANNAVVGGQLQVQGIGSSAFIQNNLTVSTGQVYFSNTILGLTNAGQANIGGPLLALSSGNGLIVSNNAIVQGNTSVWGDTIITGNTSIANNLVVTKNTSSNNINITYNSNTNTLTVFNNAYVNNDLNVSNKTLTYILQANSSVNTATLGVTGSSILNIVQANTNVNTATLSVTGNSILNVVQANTNVNTATLSVTGSSILNIVQANTNVNTATLSVTGTSYINTVVANGTSSLLGDVVIGKQDGSANSNLTVTGNFVINGQTLLDTNIITLKAVSPQPIGAGYDFIVINRGESANVVNANSQIRWNEPSRYWDIRDISSPTNYYRILTNQHLSDSTTTANSTIVATAQAVKSLNDNLQSQITANVSILSAAVTSSYSRANTSANSFICTTGSITPASGVVTLTSGNGITAVGSGSTITINTAQDIRTTATPTFQGLSLTSALPLIYGGTGATSSAGALANMLPGGATYGYVLTTGGAGSYSWAPQTGTSGVPPGTTINSARLSYTATAGQTLFTTPTYIIGSGQLRVYVDGVRQYLSDYTETTTTSVTLNVGCALNDTVLVEVDGYIINPYYANNITFTSPQGGIVAAANTIQAAIADLETRKATLVSPQLTGTPLSVTAAVGTNNTQIATTGFVYNVLGTTSATYAHNISGNAAGLSATLAVASGGTGVTTSTGTGSTVLSTSPTLVTPVLGTPTSGTLTNCTLPYSGLTGTVPTWNQNTTGLAAKASTLSQNGGTGVAMTFNWAGQGGQPSWLWGGNDGSNHYVYNPSNFSVNYASTSGSSGSCTGTAASASQLVGAAPNGIYRYTPNLHFNSGSGYALYVNWDNNSTGYAAANVSEFIIGNGSTSAVFTVSGTGNTWAAGNVTAYSDIKLKENIQTIDSALEKTLKLRGVYYTRKDHDDKTRKVGVIAQEIQEILPEVVVPTIDTENDITLSVDYGNITALLIEAIKELKLEIDILKGNK